jgi:hypothetical protein
MFRMQSDSQQLAEVMRGWVERVTKLNWGEWLIDGAGAHGHTDSIHVFHMPGIPK